jgi:N-methylhydantoinase B
VGIPIPPGAVFLVESMGGGGYGPPARRPAEARAADRVNGFVSAKPRRGRV